MRMRYLSLVSLVVLVGCGAADATQPMAAASVPTPIAAGASAVVGQAAPPFVLPSTDGSLVNLSDYAGKTVVLEWFNPGCPFVKDVHESDKMTALAEKWAAQGVVWLAVNSGAPGKQGTGLDTNGKARKDWKMGYPVLLDESGAVGQAYAAKTTPHMYVINGAGTLVFAGAFSNAPLGTVEGGGGELNYVDAALTALAAGQPVAQSAPKPWGCSVKYGS